MDTFTFACPICGQNLEVPQEAIGSSGSCPGCGATQIIPGPADEPPLPPAPLPPFQERAIYHFNSGKDRVLIYLWAVAVLAFNALGFLVDGGANFWKFRLFFLFLALVLPFVLTKQDVVIDRGARTVTQTLYLLHFFTVAKLTYHFSEFTDVYRIGPPLLVGLIKESTGQGGGDFLWVGFRKVDGGKLVVTYVRSGRIDANAEAHRIAHEIGGMTGLPVVEAVGLHGTRLMWSRAELREDLQAIHTQILDVLDQLASEDRPAVPSRSMARPQSAAYRYLEKRLIKAVAKPLAKRREAVSKLLSLVESLMEGA